MESELYSQTQPRPFFPCRFETMTCRIPLKLSAIKYRRFMSTPKKECDTSITGEDSIKDATNPYLSQKASRRPLFP
jgi:hypothetical protein